MTFTDHHGNEIGDADLISQPEVSHEIPGVVADAVELPGVDAAVETKFTEYDSNDMLTTPTEPALIQPMDDQATAFEPTRDDDDALSDLQLSLNQRHLHQQPQMEMWWHRQSQHHFRAYVDQIELLGLRQRHTFPA